MNSDEINGELTADIDKELDRVIEADLEHWKERKHSVGFVYAGESDDVVSGELYVDGQPIRPLLTGGGGWVTLNEARHVADRLGASLRMA